MKTARTQQIAATDLLARLLQAPDAKAVAAEHTDSLTEEFFMMSSTYLDMVRHHYGLGIACRACLHGIWLVHGMMMRSLVARSKSLQRKSGQNPVDDVGPNVCCRRAKKGTQMSAAS